MGNGRQPESQAFELIRPARPALSSRKGDGVRDTCPAADLSRPEEVRADEASASQRLRQRGEPEIRIEKKAHPFFQNISLPFERLKNSWRALKERFATAVGPRLG
ncbi:MAG: hypothetical protein OXF50_03975 [Caldilineaceae bacterium]|nr:hypothetical protein [Caldilineaceae bacterium]